MPWLAQPEAVLCTAGAFLCCLPVPVEGLFVVALALFSLVEHFSQLEQGRFAAILDVSDHDLGFLVYPGRNTPLV